MPFFPVDFAIKTVGFNGQRRRGSPYHVTYVIFRWMDNFVLPIITAFESRNAKTLSTRTKKRCTKNVYILNRL